MRTIVSKSLLSIVAAGALATATRADDWTGPKDAAKSAREFADAAEKVQKAIKDVDEDSPLVAEVGSLAKSAARLRDSVTKGAMYEEAKGGFRKLEAGYAHFEAGLKGAHDVHHEEPVADAAKGLKAAFDRLQAHMTGRRPPGQGEATGPRPSAEIKK